EQDLRTFLGGFGFGGDEAGQAIGPLSGGEKARLALALIIYAKPHLLLLDEPTNHLDLGMRGALTLALQAYGGALVLVSHDRSLLKSAVDEFWLVADGEVAPFDGDLDDYRDWLSRQGSSPRSADSAVPAPTLNRKDQRRFEAEQRAQAAAQRKPLANQIAQAEREIARLEAVKQDLESQLANPDLYGADRKDDLTRLLRKQGENAARLATLEANWLELQSRLEGLETTASG
ncbi:MAG: ATP-binding cassette domain-containing protein, partial [Burkholderiales bacterium]|nr:ATP-binding cassette domain-containing protein [Burkholderiales bacterium]